MGDYEARIQIYKSKMTQAKSMTDLLLAMSSWQTFCQANPLSEEEKAIVDAAYLEAEKKLIGQVKTSLW